MKCALIEFNYYHGETLPTLVYLMNRLGIEVDVYAHPHLLASNPFVYTSGLKYRAKKLSRPSRLVLSARRQWSRYDLLVLNSTEPVENMNPFQRVETPMIAITHNANFIVGEPHHLQFYAEPYRRPMVLAEHIVNNVPGLGPDGWIAPVMLGSPPRAREHGSLKRLCVQGNVAFDRRNYASLVGAIGSLADSGYIQLQVSIVGRNDSPDGQVLKNMLTSAQVNPFFSFSRGELPYRDYYASVASSDFVLPLVDLTSDAYYPYFVDKLSTSVQNSLAFGIVPIVHADLAASYGISDDSVLYDDGGLDIAIRRALSMSAAEIGSKRSGLLKAREELLARSQENLAQMLFDLGIRGPNVDGEQV
jgi:hypothetical protein